MKKIMFSDIFGLTQAVLDGRKTMTRRVIPYSKNKAFLDLLGDEGYMNTTGTLSYDEEDGAFRIDDAYACYTCRPLYKVGEVVAIAQSYKSIIEHLAKKGYDVAKWMDDNHITKNTAGWLNKMFIRAGLMIFKIRITNVRVERLKSIKDEDCLREGVKLSKEQYEYDGTKSYFVQNISGQGSRWNQMFCKHFDTPRKAFAALIDRVSGKGTWDSNPWCFVYEFELID